MTRRMNYPTKTTVNLIQKKIDKKKNAQMLGASIVFVFFLILFTKFLVIDRLGASFRAQAEADSLESQLETLKKSNADYNEVLQKYQHYFIVDEETVDCSKTMEILEKCMLDQANIVAFTSSNHVMNIQLTGITLNGVSSIVNTINNTYKNAEVFVSEATNKNSETSVVYLTIVLKE